MDSCTGKTGPHSRGRENRAQPRKLRPIFRISLTALWCAVSSEAQMTANSVVAVRLWAAGCGCETDWQQLAASRRYCAWWANHAQLFADDGLSKTGRWIIPGLTSQIDPSGKLATRVRGVACPQEGGIFGSHGRSLKPTFHLSIGSSSAGWDRGAERALCAESETKCCVAAK